MVINACTTLKNYLLVNGVSDDEFDGNFDEIIEDLYRGANYYLQEGGIQRNSLVQHFAQIN